MALFQKRPLAAACAVLLLAVFFTYFLPLWLVGVLAGVLTVFAILFFVLFLRRKSSYCRLLLFLLLFALSLGSWRVLADVGIPERALARHMDGEVRAELSVIEVSQSNAYGAQILVRVHTLNGNACDVNAILRCEHAFPFYIGDRFIGNFILHDLDFDPYDQKSVYYQKSQGAKAVLLSEQMQDFLFVESGTHSFSARWSDFRAILAHRMTRIEEGEETALLAAMLLGSKEALSPSTTRDFRLCGVSHLLALSGLHLALLVGILDRFLYFLGASKRIRIATVIPFCLFYLMLTGCNYSLLRAVLMLGFVYLAFLLRDERDALTALFLAAAIITLFTPYAVFSTSFQMTVLATLGLLSFGRIQSLLYKFLPKRKGMTGAGLDLLRAVLSSLIISFSTTVCMLPVLWLTIGSFALFTPLANLLLVPLAPLLLISALLLLLFPVHFVAQITCLVPRFVLFLTAQMASQNAMVSFSPAFVPYILIPVMLLTALFLVLDLKRFYPLVLAPSVLGVLAFAIALAVSRTAGAEKLQIVYRRAGNNEGLVLVQNDVAMICDTSNTSFTQLRADWREAQELGATRLVGLLLTHYHSKSPVALSRMTEIAAPENVWLPMPKNKKEREILVEVLQVALRKDITCTLYERGETLTVFGNGTLTVERPLWLSRSSEPAFALSIDFGERTLCYHTAALSEYLRQHEGVHACTANELILGAHGPVPHEEVQIPQTPSLSRVLVGSEKLKELMTVLPDLKYLFYPEKHLYVLE